jgi:hypothetical protein
MFAWLRRLIGWPSADELSGISLPPGECWEVSATRDSAAFVRHLPDLLPERTVLYLEGGSASEGIQTFLEPRGAPQPSQVARGTVWPRPRIYHLPMTGQNVAGLAALFETHAAPEICIHFHAYRGDELLLQWHDAFYDDPFLISLNISEDAVKRFCNTLGCTYGRCKS